VPVVPNYCRGWLLQTCFSVIDDKDHESPEFDAAYTKYHAAVNFDGCDLSILLPNACSEYSLAYFWANNFFLAKPLVAVVILNFNGRKYLESFLPFVLDSTYENFTVIVADNASTDDSVPYLQQNFPAIQIIALDKNYGFAEGYNQALKQVEAGYYVLLNSDVEVEKGWIEPVIDLMNSDVKIAACQPKIRSYHNRGYFEYAGAAGGWIDCLGYPFSRGRVFDICEKDDGQYDNIAEVFWATGAAMFVKAAVFHEMGGLDGYFFAHMEEIDLCWRMKRAGYKIMCCPASVVYHIGGGTLPKDNSRKVYLNFRNNLIMLSKNLPLSQKIWKMPLRIFLDALFAWKSLLSGYSSAFTAVLKAQFDLCRWAFKHKRSAVLPGKSLEQLSGVCNKSLIWEYFIKKKERFSEIVNKNL